MHTSATAAAFHAPATGTRPRADDVIPRLEGLRYQLPARQESTWGVRFLASLHIGPAERNGPTRAASTAHAQELSEVRSARVGFRRTLLKDLDVAHSGGGRTWLNRVKADYARQAQRFLSLSERQVARLPDALFESGVKAVAEAVAAQADAHADLLVRFNDETLVTPETFRRTARAVLVHELQELGVPHGDERVKVSQVFRRILMKEGESRRRSPVISAEFTGPSVRGVQFTIHELREAASRALGLNGYASAAPLSPSADRKSEPASPLDPVFHQNQARTPVEILCREDVRQSLLFTSAQAPGTDSKQRAHVADREAVVRRRNAWGDELIRVLAFTCPATYPANAQGVCLDAAEKAAAEALIAAAATRTLDAVSDDDLTKGIAATATVVQAYHGYCVERMRLVRETEADMIPPGDMDDVAQALFDMTMNSTAVTARAPQHVVGKGTYRRFKDAFLQQVREQLREATQALARAEQVSLERGPYRPVTLPGLKAGFDAILQREGLGREPTPRAAASSAAASSSSSSPAAPHAQAPADVSASPPTAESDR